MRCWPFVAASLLLGASAAVADEPASPAGTWSVSAIESHGTCDTFIEGTVKTRTVELTIAADGTAIAEPAKKKDRDPVFPRLEGHWDAASGVLELTGRRAPDKNVDPSVWFQLHLEDGKLVGIRRYLGINRFPDRPEGVSGAWYTCFVDSEVVATREE